MQSDASTQIKKWLSQYVKILKKAGVDPLELETFGPLEDYDNEVNYALGLLDGAAGMMDMTIGQLLCEFGVKA